MCRKSSDVASFKSQLSLSRMQRSIRSTSATEQPHSLLRTSVRVSGTTYIAHVQYVHFQSASDSGQTQKLLLYHKCLQYNKSTNVDLSCFVIEKHLVSRGYCCFSQTPRKCQGLFVLSQCMVQLCFKR